MRTENPRRLEFHFRNARPWPGDLCLVLKCSRADWALASFLSLDPSREYSPYLALNGHSRVKQNILDPSLNPLILLPFLSLHHGSSILCIPASLEICVYISFQVTSEPESCSQIMSVWLQARTLKTWNRGHTTLGLQIRTELVSFVDPGHHHSPSSCSRRWPPFSTLQPRRPLHLGHHLSFAIHSIQ